MRTKHTTNLDIRAEMKQAGIFIWQLADFVGCCDMTMTRRFRYEFTSAEKDEIRGYIAAIQQERQKHNLTLTRKEA